MNTLEGKEEFYGFFSKLALGWGQSWGIIADRTNPARVFVQIFFNAPLLLDDKKYMPRPPCDIVNRVQRGLQP